MIKQTQIFYLPRQLLHAMATFGPFFFLIALTASAFGFVNFLCLPGASTGGLLLPLPLETGG